jgi:alcohol dehydrogenase class IV
MDAMTHCIEAVLTPTVNPPAEGVGYDGLYRSWRWIRQAVQNPKDRDARWHMMMASTEGAMAFVKGLGAVHAMSHAAGRLPDLRLHHGTLNAVILPTVLRFHDGHATEKYERLRSAMGLNPGADLAKAIEGLNAEIGLPKGLGAMGLTENRIADMIPYALGDLANFGNPRKAGADEYAAMFKAAM